MSPHDPAAQPGEAGSTTRAGEREDQRGKTNKDGGGAIQTAINSAADTTMGRSPIASCRVARLSTALFAALFG